MEEKVIIAKFGKTKVAQTEKQWRYNHGQKLKFEGVDLPANYEVHFSNSKTGTAKTRIGNADGVLIPQEYFVPGEMIYAWVYVEEDGVGVTRREVRIPIDQKARPTDQQPLPEEQTIIEQAIESLNDAVNAVTDQIDAALAEAKASGEFDGTQIWWVFTTIGNGAPDHDGRILKRALNGKEGEAPLIGDFVYGPVIGSENRKITDLYVIEEITGAVVFLKHLGSIKGEDGFDPEIVVEEIPNGHRVTITSANGPESFDVMNGTFEVTGPLSMENYRLTELADGVDDTDAVNKAQVERMIREGSGLFRGSFSTKASLNMAAWQSEDPTQPYYVDNNDYCVVLSDETQHYECWRYGYVIGSGWAPQYRINEAPMTAAQIAAINSGITADRLVGLEQFKNTAQSKLSGIEAGAQVNKIEKIRVWDSTAGEYIDLPISNKIVDLPQNSGTGATVFDFVFNGLGYAVPGNDAPTLEEVLAAGENVIAKATFILDSEEIYLPLKGNDGIFTTGINNGTYFNIIYDLLDNVEVWHFIAEELPPVSPFFVTYTQGGSSVTCDKTYSEIVAALSTPQPIVVYGAVQGLGVVAATCNTSMVDGTGTITSILTTGPGDFMVIKHPASGAITMNTYEYSPIPAVSQGSTQPPTSDAVYDALADKYEVPSGGIPKTDLALDVQTSLGKADTALQNVKIPKGELDGASTATVMIATIDGITALYDGLPIWLKNGVVTSAAGVTLNINNLGAKPIYASQSAATAITTQFNVNYTALLIYNTTRVTGGCWDYVYGYETNTTYTPVKLGFGYTTCSTAEATVAKTAALSSYTLTTGGIVAVKFTNAVPANATLNINSKGAKAIYYKGAAITAGVIKAGDTVTMIYSTYYHIISIDRDEAPVTSVNGQTGAVTVPEPFVVTYSTSDMTTWTCDKTFAQITAAMAAGKQVVMLGSVGGTPIAQGCEVLLADDGSYYTEFWIRYSMRGWYHLVHHDDDSIDFYDEVMDYDTLEAVAANQGSGNADKFLVVGSDGVVVPEDIRFVVTLTPTSQDYSGVMDRTPQEITDAYFAGKRIIFDIPTLGASVEATQFISNSGQTCACANVTYSVQGMGDVLIQIITHPGPAPQGVTGEYGTNIYPLASGQWTGGSY